VIQLYGDNANDSDWLHEQGQYLIGKLAQKYPALTAQKVLDAMEEDAEKRTKPYIFYLFDAFYFCDAAQYKPRLLALLERNHLSWYDMLAATIADLQITEGLPVLRKKLRANSSINLSYQQSAVEIEEAIEILEGKLFVDPESLKPLSLTRGTSWKDDLKQNERIFYEKEGSMDDYNFSDF